MVVKGLRHLASMFPPSHFPHQVMERPNVGVHQRIGQPGLVRALLHRGDVNVVRGVKVLRLRPQFGFHVVERRLLSAGQPGAVGEQQDFGELLVALP